jgi:hypothetical protein
MRSKTIVALVLLNLALLASLCFHSFLPRAFAPPVGAAPRPSDYLMASGEVQGGTGGVVFCLDTRNGFLTVFSFNGKQLDAMPPIDLDKVLNAKP